MAETERKNQPTSSTPVQQNSPNQQMARRSPSGGLTRRGSDPFLVSPWEFFANPFGLMRRMTEEMDRAFGQFGFGQGQSTAGTASWVPAIEVAEREGNYIVHAELPGLKPEDVKVEIANDALVLRGERKSEQEENQGGIHRTERRYGQFFRTIPLPEGINADQVKAKFENGVLEVTVPVPQGQSNRREIPIEAASSASAGTSTSSSTERSQTAKA